METRDKALNLRITKTLWQDLDDYCKKNNLSKTEVVELAIKLSVYGVKLPEINKGEVEKDVSGLTNALDILISGISAVIGKYHNNIAFLDEFSYRLSETKNSMEKMRKDVNA